MIVRRWLPYVSLVASSLALGLSVALWIDARDQRADQAQAICESRNEERKVHRANLDDQIEQTEGLPDVVFEQLQLTKQDSLDRFEARKQKLHSLDCN